MVGRYVVHSRSKESRSNLVKTTGSDCKEMEIVISIHTAAHHLSNITFIHFLPPNVELKGIIIIINLIIILLILIKQ